MLNIKKLVIARGAFLNLGERSDLSAGFRPRCAKYIRSLTRGERLQKFFIYSCLLLSSGLIHAASDEQAAVSHPDSKAPPNKGNFALPGPQQPGPLISFGQTLIGRNNLQLQTDSFATFPGMGAFQNLNAAMIFGISDATTLYFNYPIQSDYTTRLGRSTGLKDITLQLEHAIYTAGTDTYQDQATLVGFVTLPLEKNNADRELSTSAGAPGYFLGATYNRTTVDWLSFISPGVFLTTPNNNIQLGSQGLYEAGIGRNIISETNRFILMGLLELDGEYTTKTHLFGHQLPDTGGNIIGLMPSLWFSTQHLIMQLGVGFPVVQSLNGNQAKTNCYVAASFTWTIA